MKILIVEDDKNIREGVADFLSEFGYNTIEASDGREALEKFATTSVLQFLIFRYHILMVWKFLRRSEN